MHLEWIGKTGRTMQSVGFWSMGRFSAPILPGPLNQVLSGLLNQTASRTHSPWPLNTLLPGHPLSPLRFS